MQARMNEISGTYVKSRQWWRPRRTVYFAQSLEREWVPACQPHNSKKGPNNNSNSNNNAEDTHIFTLEHCWDHRDTTIAEGDPEGFASGLPLAPLRAQLLPVRNSPLPQYGPNTSFLATMWETKSSEFSKIVLKDKTILPRDWKGERKVKGVKQKSRQRQRKKQKKLAHSSSYPSL